MKTFLITNFLKIATCFIFVLGCTVLSNAQEKRQILTDNSLMNAMSSNKINGLNYYHGVISEYTITTNEIKISAKDSSAVFSALTKLSGIKSCNYKPSKYSLIVTADKEESSISIVKIKEIIAPFNVHISKYQETIYSLKNN